jgi:hypothetical protein
LVLFFLGESKKKEQVITECVKPAADEEGGEAGRLPQPAGKTRPEQAAIKKTCREQRVYLNLKVGILLI